MTETIPSTIAANSTLFLGNDGEFWDFWLIISVIIAALSAIAIGVTTAGSIIAHKRETIASENALTQFKLSMDLQVSTANARALEAQLALERYKAPRSIEENNKALIVQVLSKFSGTKAAIYILGEGPEPNNLGRNIGTILNESKWDALDWNWVGAGSAVGVVVTFKHGSDIPIETACDALVSAFNSAHIEAVKQEWPGDWDHFGGMLNGPNAPSPTEAPIRIIIGTKPQ